MPLHLRRGPFLCYAGSVYITQKLYKLDLFFQTFSITGGELFERITGDDLSLTEGDCINFMRQICYGVQHMHENNILHLDLKPENIMCLDDTGYDVKIIDFGLAQRFKEGDSLKVMFGTPEFVAPEIVRYENIGFGTDMWSVGVICYTL